MLGIRTGESNPWIRTFLMAGLVLLAILFLKPVSAAADFPFEITMDANGGVFTRYELSSHQFVPTDAKVATLTMSKDGEYYHFDLGDYAAPVCEGKGFLGWSASKDRISKIYSHYVGYNGGSIDFPLDGSVTKLYAVWGDIVSLKLHANGGKFPNGSDIREMDVSWCKLESGSIYNNGSWVDPTKTDGHLLGWSTDPKAAIPKYGTVLGVFLDELKRSELYAIWADVVKVTLHANGVGRFGTRTEGGVTKDIVSINARLYYDFMLKKKTVWDSNKTTMENVDESKLLLGWYASDDYTKLYATDLSDLPIDEHTPDELYAAWVDRDVSKLSCSKIADQEATGEPVVPEVEVYHRYKKLVQGTDYTVTCTNNTEPGTAKVTVSGTGDYTGKIETSFIITKPANEPEPEPEPQPEHVHSLIKHNKVEATEDAEGTEAYWECAGCGKLFSDKDGENEIDKPVVILKQEHRDIGISMPTKTFQRWMEDGGKLESALQSAGYTVDLQYADNDLATQVSQIEDMIGNGCRLLIIAPIDGDALGTVMDQAAEKGVKVIAYDRLIMNSNAVSYYVMFSSYKVGQMQGEYIRDALNLDSAEGPFNLEITAGDPGDNNGRLFYTGAMDVLTPYIDSGKLVVRSKQISYNDTATGGWNPDTAQTRARRILNEYYTDGGRVDAWMCSNDSTAAGVIRALESGYTGKWPVITGQDADITNVKYILVGKQAMSVFKNTDILVSRTVKMSKQILSGEYVEVNDEKTYDNGYTIVPTYVCDPDTVTKSNYKEKLIDSGYYTADQFTDLPDPPAEPASVDTVVDFVTRCYRLILNREPDEGGLQGWSESLKSKTAAAAQIINGFVSSPEYINRDLGDAESVDILYKTMLDRQADAEGKAGWVDALGKGYTLQHIINGFCASDEFTALCRDYGIEPGIVNVNPVNPEPAPDTPRGKIEAFVKRCYKLILNRDADQGGLQGWSDALETGAGQACQIIDGFVRSPEYVNRNLSNAESVDILYQTMLNRAADEGGKAGWVDALNQGYTLQHIINGFCGSAEFTSICNEFGITAGNLLVQGVLVKREAITPEGEEEAPVVYVNYSSEFTNEEKIRAFVEHCYEAVFGREGDTEGVEAWTRLILDGKKTPKRVAYEFIFSDEFQNQLPGNEAFIRILYRLYLSREPGAEELTGWTAMLENGAGLEEIVNGFAGSAEFKAIVNRMKN